MDIAAGNAREIHIAVKILDDRVLRNSKDDDDTLLKSKEIQVRMCTLRSDDTTSTFLSRYNLASYYLWIRFKGENESIVNIRLPFITNTTGNNNSREEKNTCLFDQLVSIFNHGPGNHAELIVKPMPIGLKYLKKLEPHPPDTANSITSITMASSSYLSVSKYRMLSLGEHYLYSSRDFEWFRRFLVLGKVSHYPYCFSSTKMVDDELRKESFQQMNILYLFDQEDLMEPIAAFPTSTIKDILPRASDKRKFSKGKLLHNIWTLSLMIRGKVCYMKLSFQGSNDRDEMQSIIRVLRSSSLPVVSVPLGERDVSPVNILQWYIEYLIHLMMITTSSTGNHLLVRGIFRVPGKLTLIDQLYQLISGSKSIPGEEHVVDRINSLESNDLAGLLKRLIREYPGRLICKTETDALLSGDPRDGAKRTLSLLQASSQSNCHTNAQQRQRHLLLIRLMKFLKYTSTFSHEAEGNSMNMYNLAVVFSPNIFDFQPHSDTKHEDVQISLKQMTFIIEYLIQHCPDPEEYEDQTDRQV